MDLAERWEPLRVVSPEVAADGPVGVEAEELPDDLDGYDLRVGELGGGAAPAYALAFEPIVHQAEDGHREPDDPHQVHHGPRGERAEEVGVPPHYAELRTHPRRWPPHGRRHATAARSGQWPRHFGERDDRRACDERQQLSQWPLTSPASL